MLAALIFAVAVVCLIAFAAKSKGAENRARKEMNAAKSAEKEQLAKKAAELEEYMNRVHSLGNKYEHIKFRLKGVIYQNEDGSSRQDYLQKIKLGKAPFEKKPDFTIRRFEYDGEPAMAVLANGLQIGNVPKEVVPKLLEKWERFDCISALDVIGGGKGKYSGEKLSYGAEVFARFFAEKED